MTIDGKTICNLIQSFPVLLILAQNNNKCLKTPFIYKPPSPTHPPDYYEAYDALIQNLFGHDCYYTKKFLHHTKPSCYDDHSYGHETPVYGHGYGYPYGYPSHGYGYGHEHQSGYPGVLLSDGHLGISRKGIIGNGSMDYKSNYAPKQMYNVKRRVKVVVKNKGEKKKRSQQLKTKTF
ncbi:unnamed protein product [Colias eurytheme]|nr:unnamed protein product [Colias eurytheme]